MKMTIAYTNICLLFLLFGNLTAQNDNSKIVGIWEFQTITSIYYSTPQETSYTARDNNHRETLTFREDGTFSYHGVDEGSKYASIGSWNEENTTLTMDASGVKTICDFEVTGDIMTLTIREEESEEFYKMFSVLKYKNKIISH